MVPNDSAQPALREPTGCSIRAVEFDFETKQERTVTLEALQGPTPPHKFYWVDIDVHDREAGADFLCSFGLADREVIDDALKLEGGTNHTRFETYLYLALTGCEVEGLGLKQQRLGVIMAESFMLTIHQGRVQFLEAILKEYSSDFIRFAKGPSFLIYELWDHLTENYIQAQDHFEVRVAELQTELMAADDDEVFGRVSELGTDLLNFRKVLLPARSVLLELSSRKSAFISEETRPFMANMAGTVERVLQDLLVDRDILSESLNLYVSMVSHKTNEVMRRLTIVSVVFLPLTFLCGVYGMNFVAIPELSWRFGYLYFWITTGLVVALLLFVLKRARML